MERTAEELKSAVGSMFRVRAVESPPDERGQRRIWHRGTRGADLVTVVDGAGRVISHEFALFDDWLRWDRDAGVTAGTVMQVEGGADRVPDATQAPVILGRAAAALTDYSGPDKYLGHLRDQVAAQAGTSGQRAPRGVVVTGGAQPAQPAPRPVPSRALWPAVIASGVLLIALAAYLLTR